MDSQAFNLFSHGTKAIEVAIELDLAATKVQKFYRDYLKLIRYDKVTLLYDRIEDIENLAKYVDELVVLDKKIKNLKRDISVLQNIKYGYHRLCFYGA